MSGSRSFAFLSAPRPMGFAHRGGAALCPENTLESFRGALELGYRYIETDVHVSSDGTLVCFHDETLDRTTNGTGLLRKRTLGELKALDAGYHFTRDGVSFPFRGKGCTIPTFDELVALGPDLMLNIEIKQKTPDATGLVWDAIEAKKLRDRVLIASADHTILSRFRARAGDAICTAASQREVIVFLLASKLRLSKVLRPRYQALQVPRASGALRVIDRHFVSAAHRFGIQVHAWTIDERRDMEELLALGVDGIMTDRPDILGSLIGIKPSEPPR